MNLAVIHRIHDPAAWAEALASDHSYPPDFHLHSFVEAEDRRVALCVWEAPTEAALQGELDRIFGHAVVNDVFPAELHLMGGRGMDDYVPSWQD